MPPVSLAGEDLIDRERPPEKNPATGFTFEIANGTHTIFQFATPEYIIVEAWNKILDRLRVDSSQKARKKLAEEIEKLYRGNGRSERLGQYRAFVTFTAKTVRKRECRLSEYFYPVTLFKQRIVNKKGTTLKNLAQKLCQAGESTSVPLGRMLKDLRNLEDIVSQKTVEEIIKLAGINIKTTSQPLIL